MWYSQGALGASSEGPVSLPIKGVFTPFFRDNGEGDKSVGPFVADRMPVTNGEFLEFVTSHPEWRRSKTKAVFSDKSYLRHWRGDLEFDPAIARLPVVNVSWFAARKFCEARGARLLTVSEWEFAADAQDQKALEKILAWYARPDTPLVRVGLGEANRFGLHDMHGLIWEWVEDYASVIVAGDSRDSNEANGAKFCGSGSLKAKDPNAYAAFMRYAYRSSLKGAFSASTLGFRCGRDVADKAK
jgi:formylglycine-generating enzyme required for sulfatase activity